MDSGFHPIFQGIRGRRVLISPLGWGLGHAARIANVARFLMLRNHVVLMCGHAAEAFLRQEVPGAEIVVVDDWKIRYPKGRISLLSIMGWVPVMMRNTFHEHLFAKRIIRDHNIDLILSDNRYGLCYRGLECMIVTHQVYPKAPRGWGWAEGLSGFFFKSFLSLFNKVLIPDFRAGESLSGMLAADRRLDPEKFVRVGILSRYSGYAGISTMDSRPRRYDVLLLISGQEHQRTVFENMLIRALLGSGKRVLLARGVGEQHQPPIHADTLEYRNMLGGNALAEAMLESAVVVCRAGYSTLCDVVALGRRAVIVPTPGQTEQEYLARRLDGRLGFRSLYQDDPDFADRLLKLLHEGGEGVPGHE